MRTASLRKAATRDLFPWARSLSARFSQLLSQCHQSAFVNILCEFVDFVGTALDVLALVNVRFGGFDCVRVLS
jgi:hypothetical protein